MKHFKSIYLVGWLLVGSLLLSLYSCDEKNRPNNGQDPKMEITAEGVLKTFPATLIPADGVVELPETVKTIGVGVFKNATALKRLTGAAVVTVDESAFEGCTTLEEVTLPAVTEIKANSFKGCANLSTLKVGKELPTTDDTAFEGTKTEKNLVVEGATVDAMSENLLDYLTKHHFAQLNGKELPNMVVTPEGKLIKYNYAALDSDKALELPEAVKTIGAGVFKDFTALEYLHGDGVATIEANALEGCTNLQRVATVNVTTIEEGAFKGCANLKEFALGGDGSEAPKVTGHPFEGTPEDKDLLIEHADATWVLDFCKAHGFATINGKVPFDYSNPGHYESPTYPGEDDTTPPAGFQVEGTTITGIADQSQIKEHTIIPNYIKGIGRNALTQLNGVKKFTAKGVEKLDVRAFYNAYGLRDLIDLEMPNLKEIGNRALGLSYSSNLKNLNKLHSVEVIGNMAFEYLEGLTFIYLPNVKKLGDDVFFGVRGLTQPGSMVYFGATPPEIGSLGIKVHTLVIPKGSKANYEGWNHADKFGQILELGDPGTEKFEEYLNWSTDI